MICWYTHPGKTFGHEAIKQIKEKLLNKLIAVVCRNGLSFKLDMKEKLKDAGQGPERYTHLSVHVGCMRTETSLKAVYVRKQI